MARPIHWRDLRLGLIGLGAVVGLALAVLVFARIGGVRGRKITLYVTAGNANGILNGSQVLVGGKQVGQVKSISFREASADTTERLLIETRILQSARELVRRDSRAQIHPSGTIIGAAVLEITAGSGLQPALSEGDTVRAAMQIAAATVVERLASLGTEFVGLRRQVTDIMGDIDSARGTFGAIRTRGPIDVAAFRARAARFTAQLSGGQGSMALAMNDDELGRRAGAVAAAMDTIGTLLSTPTGNIGRFRRDRTLAAEMESVRTEAAVLSASLRDARGTAGRIASDAALRQEFDALSRQFGALVADFKKNPFRYLAF